MQQLSYTTVSPRRQQLDLLCLRSTEHVDTHGELLHAVFHLLYASHDNPEGWRQLFMSWTYKEGITDGYSLRVLPDYAKRTPISFLGQRLAALTAPYRI